MRQAILLCELPNLLCEIGASLPDEAARRPGPEGSFSFVEHVWHLAELEAEAFGVRIGRLLGEDEPFLEDFDGDRIAIERDYRARRVGPGLEGFRDARAANLERLARVSVDEAMRGGTLEGVGRIVLGDLPARMLGHDRAHAEQIASLLGLVAPGHGAIARLEAWAALGEAGAVSPCARRAEARRSPIGPVAPGASPTEARARRALASMLGDPPNVGRVAAALRMSPRTLQRRLAARGLTLQCLAEEARMAAALAFVREGRRPLGEVASLLGYSELRAFLRAFKRWTGRTPGAFRRAPALVAGGC